MLTNRNVKWYAQCTSDYTTYPDRPEVWCWSNLFGGADRSLQESVARVKAWVGESVHHRRYVFRFKRAINEIILLEDVANGTAIKQFTSQPHTVRAVTPSEVTPQN